MTFESWLKPSLILNLTAGDEPEDEPGIENLRGYGDLVDWGRRVGLLAEDEVGRLLDEAARSLEEVGSVHARALELRGGIYEVCWAVAERERPPSAAMEHLHRVEGEAISRGRLLTREARARRGRIRLGVANRVNLSKRYGPWRTRLSGF
jgi:hypothetical protein